MSDRYRKVDAYKCEECGDLYDHPSLAEKCSKQDQMLRLAREIAELRIRGDIYEGKHPHTKIEVGAIIDKLKEERDELEEQFGDECDHMEAMKDVMVDGGVYCHECKEQVNEYPKEVETVNLRELVQDAVNDDG